MRLDMDDGLLNHLAQLPPLMPDPVRAERVRARCRARVQIGGRWASLALPAAALNKYVAPAVLGGICALYLAAVVVIVIRLRAAI